MTVSEELQSQAADAAQAYGVRLGKMGVGPEERLGMVVAYYDGWIQGRTFTEPPAPRICGHSRNDRVCVLQVDEKGLHKGKHVSEDHHMWSDQ